MDMKDIHLDEATRARLKGCLGFEVDARFKYVPRAYRGLEIGDNREEVKAYEPLPKAIWPVFELKARDGLSAARSEDELKGVVEYDQGRRVMRMDAPKSGQVRIDILAAGLCGVRNFAIDDGSGCSLEAMPRLSYDSEKRVITVGDKTRENVETLEVLKYIPPALQVELANAITSRSTLTADEMRGLE